MECENSNNCPHLPELVLSKIFGYISVEDLLTVQSISHQWLIAANDPDIWKQATLKIDCEDSVESVVAKLHYLPKLKHITSERWVCFDTKAFVQALVKHVTSLKTLNVVFHPFLAAKQLKWIVKKFHELEFINLNYNAPDFISSLYTLKRCKNLKYVNIGFNPLPYNIPVRARPLQGTFGERICYILGHHLKSVNNLDIVNFQDYYIAENNLINLLDIKSNKLRSLNAVCNGQEIFDVILRCTVLQELSLIVKFLPAPLSLTGFINLKCLSLYIETSEQEIISVFFPASIEKLIWSFSLVGVKDSVIFSDCVMSTIQNLKHLEFSNCSDPNIDNALNSVTSLSKLETLILRNVQHISDVGIGHIAKCEQLRHLVLENIPVTNLSLNHITKCSKLLSLTFTKCDFDSDNLYQTLTELTHLTEVKLPNTPVIQIVLRTLEEENIYINIKIHGTAVY